MRKLTVLFLGGLLSFVCISPVHAQDPAEACVLLYDENGNIINQEEYEKCLEEIGGIQTYEHKFPDDKK